MTLVNAVAAAAAACLRYAIYFVRSCTINRSLSIVAAAVVVVRTAVTGAGEPARAIMKIIMMVKVD